MINIDELRRNNLIRYSYETLPVFRILEDSVVIRTGPNSLRTLKPDNIYPVPLSVELLEACGFERSEGSYEAVLWTNRIRLYEHDVSEYSLYAYNDHKVYVSYLHELMNLFRDLTGTELTVNLDKVKV